MTDDYSGEPLEDDDAQYADVDPEAELPVPAATIQLAPEPPAGEPERLDVSPEEAREVMAALLDMFEEEGRETVGPKDFMEHCDRHGRSRGWVSGQIAQMVISGRLAETRVTGRYRIVPQLVAA
jgi:hypothetical protein